MLAPWFERYPDILAQEKAMMSERGFQLDESSWTAAGVLSFQGASRTQPERRLTVTYPSGFPSFPPRIVDDGGLPLLPRHHHPQSRELCLFGPGSFRWTSNLTGAHALEEAESVIAQALAAPTEIPEGSGPPPDVPEPVSALLPVMLHAGVLIPHELVEWGSRAIEAGPKIESCFLHVTTDPKRPRRGVVVEFTDARKVIPTSKFYHQLRGASERRKANLIVLKQTPPVLRTASDLDRWQRLAGAKTGAQPGWYVYAYPEESGTSAGTALAWTVVHLERQRFEVFRGFPIREEDRASRIPGLEFLREKRVVLIGVGSLGSRIATCLVASGLRKLTLIDRDVYEPHNSTRHELGFVHFGEPKAQAMLHRLNELNPLAAPHLQAMTCFVGDAPKQHEEAVFESLAQADLVINATGSEQASHWIDEVCHDLKKPRLHASVTNGAWGGEVIRVVPQRSACWLCHQMQGEEPSIQPRPPRLLFAPGCIQPTFTGSLPELSVVADLASDVAIRTLKNDPSHDFQGSHIRWQGRDRNGLPAPHVSVHQPSARPQCFLCSAK